VTDESRTWWIDSGPEDLGDGIHRIPLPLPTDALRAVNVYVIEDGGQLVLVDGGWALPESEQVLRSGLGKLGYDPRDITDFLVTHIHRDHYTQAVALRELYGCRVGIGSGERPNFDQILSTLGASLPSSDEIERIRTRGAGELADWCTANRYSISESDQRNWKLPDRWLDDGQVLELASRNLTVIATPGHTRGHVVFRDERAGLLFAGDHVLPYITPSIGLESAPVSFPLRDYLGALTLVRSLPDSRLLPAHGPAVGSVHARVDELLSHHDERLAASAQVIADGAATAYDAARRLTWTRRATRFDDLDHFNQLMALGETAAHLNLLVLRGQLSMQPLGEDGVQRYAYEDQLFESRPVPPTG